MIGNALFDDFEESVGRLVPVILKQQNIMGDIQLNPVGKMPLLWADHDTNLDEALRIARADRETNNDLLASDTFAWALYKKGNFPAAKNQIEDALRLNSKNALFYYHLGMIENALGNKKEAVRNLELALATNPAFDLLQADIARKTLKKLRS